jgi:acyl-CoA thioesterase FadM
MTVQVTYDYHAHQTIPIPDHWREIITQFESL